MYSYDANDGEELLENFFDKDVPLETFGISQATYDAVNNIHDICTIYDIKKIEDISDMKCVANMNLFQISGNEANKAIEVLTSFGFANYEEAEKAFSIAYIYNAYYYTGKNEADRGYTVYGVLDHAYKKALKFHPEAREYLLPPPKKGDMVEYLMNLTLEQFVSIGW